MSAHDTGADHCHSRRDPGFIFSLHMQAGRRKQQEQSPGPIRIMQHSTRPKACLLCQAAMQTGSQVTAGLRLQPDLAVQPHSQQKSLWQHNSLIATHQNTL